MTVDDRAAAAPPPADARLAAGARVGRYEILGELGAGGMGVVYEARDPELNRKVAVKLLRRADRGDALRLLREAQALAQLQHPSVVAIHDVGIADDGLFLAMELVDGENLALHLARHPTTWRRILALYVQAGHGLAAAHAKAIVHRDVKPSNVLCDRAGRVRIGDFGLARIAAPDAASETRAPAATAAGMPPPSAAPAAAETVDADTPSVGGADRGAATPGVGLLASPLTGAGALLGTPRYMAPEQRDRQPATARSDQYSFCVCLWEALYGTHPFPDGHATDRVAGPRRGPGRRVPGWLARTLEIGLAHDPARRHPSMTALLDVLERTPRRRRWIGGAAAATTVALAGTAALLLTRAAPVDPCGAIGPLPAWDAAAHDAVRAAFTTSGVSFAATTFTTVAARLDDHAARWRAMRIASCRATRVTRVQSAALLDARTACLDRRADEVAALVAVLRTADRAVVTRAADAVGALGDLGGCADAVGLARRTPLPADPAQAEAIRALEREVAALAAELDSGRVADRAPRVADVVTRARAANHPPLLVAALQLDHKLQVVGDHWTEAEHAAEAALLAAEAAGDDAARFNLMASLIETVGLRLHKAEDAARHTRDALALQARLGDDPMRTARLRCAVALDGWSRGQYLEALEAARACVAERERAATRDDALIARGLHLQAILLEALNRNPQALAVEERAIALATKVLGEDHPDLARMLNTAGVVLREDGKLAEAAALLRRVRTIQESADPGSTSLAGTLHNLGNVLRDSHELTEAEAAYRQAIAMFEARLGPDSNRVADALDMLGLTLTDLGRGEEGEAAALRSLAIREHNGDGGHPAQAAALRLLGKQYRRRDMPAQALVRYQAALAIAEAKYGAADPRVASSLAGIGEALDDLGRHAEARAALERALPLTDDPAAANQKDRVQFALARALWSTPAQRARARTLVDAALAVRQADADAEAIAEIEAWRTTTGAK